MIEKGRSRDTHTLPHFDREEYLKDMEVSFYGDTPKEDYKGRYAKAYEHVMHAQEWIQLDPLPPKPEEIDEITDDDVLDLERDMFMMSHFAFVAVRERFAIISDVFKIGQESPQG